MSNIAVLPDKAKEVSLGPNGPGVIFRLYSEDTGGRFAVVEHPIPPGNLAVPHVHHNEDEYSYVLEGEVAFQLGEKVTYERPGALIVKPREIWHAFWNESSASARILEIISPGGFEHYFEEMAELFATGRIREAEEAFKVGQKYNIQADPSRLVALVEKYHLKPWEMGPRQLP